ncbi:MAG: Mu transposase C-terminal domain-containing protein [Deltaproteobacteria bacterium]|nr:Mu transposase C-terminal domain-containing protein [Deltaproteobacteria bacterium]MBW2081658.1 Mu transposase C-terminal domain-containing protein [Deltaproteobacteria bacterium]MBW2298853.1 Mu transposase C-terminal domain-containing protein [Deltaproteobacteria bacterium]
MNGYDLVAPAEIAECLRISVRAVHKRAKKESWRAQKVNGRGDKRFHLAELPEEVKIAVMVNRAKTGAPDLYNKDRRVAVGSPELSEWQNRIALARADLVRAYVAEKKRAKAAGGSAVRAAELFIKGYNTGNLMPRVYEILGPTSWKSVERWRKELQRKDHDFTKIAPMWGNNRGKRKVTDQEFNMLLSFALHPNRLRISEVCRLTKLALRKRQVPSPSSEATLRRALEDWKATHYDQWVFCREGEKALNDKCLPYLERDAGLLEVGEVLVADGHPLNFQCLNPYTGKPCRASLLMWYDWASCMPAGWEIMPTENVQCVAAGLRRAILALGKMPKVAYLDNGKAFKAKIFTSTDIDFEEAGFYGMFARLGIETTFAWPYNAQSKPVERFFGTFNELERLMPTYTGASIQDKPAHMLRNERLHKKIHEKKYGGWVPTIEEANRIIAGWVAEYARRPHRGLKGLCPIEVWEAGKGPGVDERALRFLMMSMEPKAPPGRNGIRFMGRNYYDEALYGYKERVMIRYDLEDLSRIYVYEQKGSRLLCEAEAVEPVHPMAKLTGQKEDLALVKMGIERKRKLQKTTETVARSYVESAPSLVAIPERAKEGPGRKKKPRALARAEAERIEAEASRMKVLELKPKKQEPVYMSEPDRYEALLERECRGEELSLDDMQFMRYFEKTKTFRQLKPRFESLQELWLAGPEEQEEGSRS